jgi:hypothetical protein
LPTLEEVFMAATGTTMEEAEYRIEDEVKKAA